MKYQEAVSSIEAYWDDRACSFDREHDTEDLDMWRSVLQDLVGENHKQTILDLGAGTGFLTNMLADMGYPTIGIDVSQGMMDYGVRRAELNGVPAFYMKGDAVSLPFCDNSVDCIINARLIWTMVEPQKMFREWLRVLKPGGKILCLNRMKDDHGLKRYEGFDYIGDELRAELTLENASFQELCDTLAGCGYQDPACIRLSEALTRPEFSYDAWYALIGVKPVDKTHHDEMGMSSYWDYSALTYDERHELHDDAHWMEVLSRLVGPEKEARILDVATGTAMIANYLASAGYTHVVGADISEEMMRAGVRRVEASGNSVDFVYGNTLDLPFADGSFDVVINSRLLWTLTEPYRAIREWHRVLKPGGRVVAINELEETGIQVDTGGMYTERTGVADLPFANASTQEIVDVFKSQGFADAAVSHMEGCRMESSDRENWFAFVGTKAEA